MKRFYFIFLKNVREHEEKLHGTIFFLSKYLKSMYCCNFIIIKKKILGNPNRTM